MIQNLRPGRLCVGTPRQQTKFVVRATSGGFGKTNKKRVDTTGGSYTTNRTKRNVDILEELKDSKQPSQPGTAAAQSPTGRGTATPADLATGSWIEVLPDVDDFFAKAGKDVKALTLAAGRTVVLYRMHNVVYCSDVYSTAYKYPMVDAKLVQENGVPAVEVPLDGTIYELRTGKVLKWCPSGGNAIRNFLVTLKKNSQPVDLQVFPTQVTPEGKLRIKLI